MSQDQESEEVKPEKLNLNISYDRSSKAFDSKTVVMVTDRS